MIFKERTFFFMYYHKRLAKINTHYSTPLKLLITVIGKYCWKNAVNWLLPKTKLLKLSGLLYSEIQMKGSCSELILKHRNRLEILENWVQQTCCCLKPALFELTTTFWHIFGTQWKLMLFPKWMSKSLVQKSSI